MPSLTFQLPDGTEKRVTVAPGTTVLEAAHENDLDGLLEGTCGQCLACATCHVVIDPAWYDRLEEPSEEEEDMLDLAVLVEDTSRLGCQVVVDAKTDGLVVRVPAAG